MRSKEVADLAGVSVRTLRHYHQIGLLPEPDRGSNGYRDYGLSDVALLLRIRRLASLGVALDRMAPFLDAPDDGEGVARLDELHDELGARIRHLQEQQAMIAELRAGRGRPDLPPAMVAFSETVGVLDDVILAGLERDAGLVIARLVGEGDETSLRALADGLAHLRDHERYLAFAEQFTHLPATASDDEIDAVVTSLLDAFGQELKELLAGPAGEQLRRVPVSAIPAIDEDPRLNDAQAEVLRRIGDYLA